jgi:hypothetical protein
MKPPASGEPDTGPPKKEPGLAARAKVNQQRLNSCGRSYHSRSQAPTGFPLSLALLCPGGGCP